MNELKHRPFQTLYKNEQDKWIEKSLYHSHRLTECLHKLKKLYEKNYPHPDTPHD